MKCHCKELSQLVDVEDTPANFEKGLTELKSGNWVRLMQCPNCEQLWRISVWDKYQVQFAFKIDDIEGWEEFDNLELQKKFLLESRGGTESSGQCAMKNCVALPVKNIAFCLEHLYETGARK